MDKKLTTSLGIALGTSLLAAAGYGIYKFISNKRAKTKLKEGGTSPGSGYVNGFIGNSLVKSNSLYGNSALTRSNGMYENALLETA
ncbi:hypothetical protein GCM10028805_50820 [Spirosoma harenae]